MKVIASDIVVCFLKNILEENSDKPQSIRIYFLGMSCGGPTFGLTLDEQTERDSECYIKELHFIMDTLEFDNYGNMIIEDAGFSFIVRPENIQKIPDCSECGTIVLNKGY